MAGPIAFIYLDAIFLTVGDLVRDSVLQQQAQRVLPALQADIDAGDKAAVGVHHCVDDWAANRLARQAADNVNISHGGVCHKGADGRGVVADRTRDRAVVALVCLNALAADSLVDGVTVLPVEVTELPECRALGQQSPTGIAVLGLQHHSVGGLQALSLGRVKEFVQRPAENPFVCGQGAGLFGGSLLG